MGLKDTVAPDPHVMHEKAEAKAGGSKLPKVIEQVSGGSAHPRLPISWRGAEGRNACDIFGPVLGT